MAKLREERFEEKRRNLRMSLRDSINFREELGIKNDNENKEEKKDEIMNEQKNSEN